MVTPRERKLERALIQALAAMLQADGHLEAIPSDATLDETRDGMFATHVVLDNAVEEGLQALKTPESKTARI